MVTPIALLCISALIRLSNGVVDTTHDNDGSPEFREADFNLCVKAAWKEYHVDKGASMPNSWFNIRKADGFYTCRETKWDLIQNMVGSFDYDELTALEECYAEKVMLAMKLPEPHTLEAFEKRFGSMEILLRSQRCKEEKKYSIITNKQTLDNIKITAWKWCLTEVKPEDVKGMKEYHVCRSSKPFSSVWALYKFMYTNPDMSKNFDACFKRRAATKEILGIENLADFESKYEAGMIIKHLRCQQAKDEEAEKEKAKAQWTTWKQALAAIVKRGKAAFIGVAHRVQKLFSVKQRECWTKIDHAKTTWNDIVCVKEKRKALMHCVFGNEVAKHESKDAAANDAIAAAQEPPVLANVNEKETENGMLKRMVHTLATPVRSIQQMICPTKPAELTPDSLGKTTLQATVDSLGITDAEAKAATPRRRKRDADLVAGIIFVLVLLIIVVGFYVGAFILCVMLFNAIVPGCGWFFALLTTLLFWYYIVPG